VATGESQSSRKAKQLQELMLLLYKHTAKSWRGKFCTRQLLLVRYFCSSSKRDALWSFTSLHADKAAGA
jgi:hypothetical protein